jgi:hypothetical protein
MAKQGRSVTLSAIDSILESMPGSAFGSIFESVSHVGWESAIESNWEYI